MVLSYDCRLACLMLFSAGLMQIALASLLSLLGPVLHSGLGARNPRWAERACFAELIVSHLAAFALVFAVVAPQYVHNEANLSKEYVGLVCIVGALLVAVRYMYAIARAIGLICSTRRRPEAAVTCLMTGVSVQITENEHPLLAVMGLFSPRIVVSRCFLDSGTLSPEALEIALIHECAHVRQFDNLKLLALSSLALPFHSNTASHRWRRAAEIAADEDAIAGSRQRAILLAETLLRAARTSPYQPHATLALGFLPHEEDLAVRVRRLLSEEPVGDAGVRLFSPRGMAMLLCGTACLLLPFAIAPLHECAEYLLHLG